MQREASMKRVFRGAAVVAASVSLVACSSVGSEAASVTSSLTESPASVLYMPSGGVCATEADATFDLEDEAQCTSEPADELPLSASIETRIGLLAEKKKTGGPGGCGVGDPMGGLPDPIPNDEAGRIDYVLKYMCNASTAYCGFWPKYMKVCGRYIWVGGSASEGATACAGFGFCERRDAYVSTINGLFAKGDIAGACKEVYANVRDGVYCDGRRYANCGERSWLSACMAWERGFRSGYCVVDGDDHQLGVFQTADGKWCIADGFGDACDTKDRKAAEANCGLTFNDGPPKTLTNAKGEVVKKFRDCGFLELPKK